MLLLLSFGTAFAQTFPEDRDFFVNDYADLLNVQQETALRQTLEEFYQARDIEFTVLTINRMSDYGHVGAIEPFATDLFNVWGIGDAQRNDGLLLLVSRLDRELRIEVGAGYGDSLNGPMQRIINKQIVPYFRLDDYPAGIAAGVDEIIYQVAGRYPGEYDYSWARHAATRVLRGFTNVVSLLGAWLFLLIIPAIPFGLRGYKRWQRNHARKCPNDGSRMRRYLEETEDAVLTPGQQLEERLKSIDHDVWFCDTCDHITIESYPTKQKTYGACS
ncbi:MAG: TPM domain-containing protein, partial [Pseudomonadota bacterium]